MLQYELKYIALLKIMAGERQQRTYPDHFIPLSGEESPLGPEVELFPNALLDIFNLIDPITGNVETVCVLGCSGDAIDIVPIDHVEGPIAQEVNSARVSRHGVFRYVEAAEVDFFRMVGLSQQADHKGYNDPVVMHTVHNAKAEFDNGELKVTRFDSRGNLTAGRLDVLRAYQKSQEPSTQFGEQGATIAQLTVQTRPIQKLQQGKGVGMAYPMISSDIIGHTGNNDVLMRVAYDLLVEVQTELLERGVDHPLADEIIPVANRDRLIRDLVSDGFKVTGDRAVRINSGDGSDISFLNRLRVLFLEFDGDVIDIPPQATAEDYLGYIEEVLVELSTKEDETLANLMERIVRDVQHVEPPKAAPLPPVIVNTTRISTARPVRTSPRPRPAQRPTMRTAPPKHDWARDFTPIQTPKSAGREDWQDDFSDNQSPATITTTVEDWAVDFAPHTPTPASKWADDFK
ncbi:hypothetical protein KBD09_02400 [Candidatus Woesebacteria bacterium]|nr:hypothetical protein [Candidatus Woesebacteria bacterium]